MEALPIGIAAGLLKSSARIDTALLGLSEYDVYGSFTLPPNQGNAEPFWWFDEETLGSVNAVFLKQNGLPYFLEFDLPIIVELHRKYPNCKIRISLALLRKGDLRKMLARIAKSPLCQHIELIEIDAACPVLMSDGQKDPVLAKDPDAVKELLLETRDFTHGKLGLKIAPKTDDAVLHKIIDLCLEHQISTLISGNTDRGSSVIKGTQRLSVPIGGHGGAPLLPFALLQAETIVRMLEQKNVRKLLTLDGCGGIMFGRDIVAYQDVGVDSVQLASVAQRFGTKGVRDVRLEYYSVR